jgi:hypothetical protein
MNDGQQYRVRPWLRTTAIVAFVFLTPIAAHALWDLIEARRLSAVVETLRARGEMVHWSTWRPGTPSPEEKAAARYYTAAAVLARDATVVRFRETNETIAALAALQPRDVARDARFHRLQLVLDEYAPVLDLLDRANALGVDDIRSGDELRARVPDRHLANVYGVRIARSSFLGNATEAVTALSETLELPNLPALWPVGIDTTPSLRLLLMFAPPDAARLAKLQRQYARLAQTDDQRVENELVESRARLITAAWPGAVSQLPVVPRLRGMSGGRADISEVLFRPWLTRHVTRRLAEYDEALSVARQPWPARLDMAIALTERARESSRGGLLNRMWPVMGDFSAASLSAGLVSYWAKRAANDTARQRVAVVALAIEQFRRAHSDALPADLAALVPQYLDAVPIDPYTGAPLKFTHSAEGYKVYSVGLNRTDDGGDWGRAAVKTPEPTTLVVAKDIGIDIRKF